MRKSLFYVLLMPVLVWAQACELVEQELQDAVESNVPPVPSPEPATEFIAGDAIAHQSVLRSIPTEYIDKARQTLHIAYQHTSHGTHVSRGLFGLPHFKAGDDQLFAITDENPTENQLDFNDNVLAAYAPSGTTTTDLGSNERAFVQATRNFLDAKKNSHINVIMWSWCDISGHDIRNNYLPGMETLINEYGEGGSKIGSAPDQRTNPVHFIFMTGHAVANRNIGEGRPKNQADLITDYCNQNKLFCLDYYSIDTHDMDGNYWEDASDDGYSDQYDGNFFKEWQSSHTLGTDFYENRISPEGRTIYGAHNTQHITANRKAFAMWWILARIAGWNGKKQ